VIALGARTDGTEHRLWVRDAGAGIEPADQELIFERFHRGAQGTSRTTDDGGAGLGLSIVNAIVEAHHGTVIVDSTPGHGATFTMIIPQRPPAAAADRPTGPVLEEQPWPRS
jgi:two-component system, OmpR family, sensor kinase